MSGQPISAMRATQLLDGTHLCSRYSANRFVHREGELACNRVVPHDVHGVDRHAVVLRDLVETNDWEVQLERSTGRCHPLAR